MPTRSLSPDLQALVEEFGNIYERHGFQRLKGLLVGLVLSQPEPLSLDEMASLLGRSKGPISVAVRELAVNGLLRRVEGPENRRDYYTVHPDLFFNNFQFNLQTVRRNLATAEHYLERLKDQPASEPTVGHLETMRRFYALMESYYQGFAAEWEKVRSERES